MTKKIVTIGTRGSDLAMWQAHFLQSELQRIGIESKLEIISTKGDRIQDLSFNKIEGKGFFTKEIEDALLDGSIDIAVHSMKDLPTNGPEDLVIAAVSYREKVNDCLLLRKEVLAGKTIHHMPADTIIGTSSARRKCQSKDIFPQVLTKDIRGNVPTRLAKLRSGDFDGILLASAGLERLKLDVSDLDVFHLNPKEFVPAPAQGVLAFQCRKIDVETRKALAQIHNSEVASQIMIERKVLNMMEGGCQMPLGVYCEKDQDGYFHVSAAFAEHVDAPIQRVFTSRSTTDGLAQTIFDLLKKP